MTCLECCGPIPPKPPGLCGRKRKFCTLRCQKRWHKRAWNATHPPVYVADPNPRAFASRECEMCSADLSLCEGRKLCTDCARIRRHQREAAKRGLAREVECEPYTLEEIAARDRYSCQICLAVGLTRRQARVSMKAKVPDAKAPTIDHIVARADGGNDTRVNVQLAHFICNCWKGSRALEQQLMLVG